MKTAAGILLSVCILVCVAAGLRLWGLRLNLDIKPTELASLLVTVFIAVFLQYYLATQVSDRRVEKNLLIDDCQDAAVILRNCRDVFWASYDSGKLTNQNKTSILRLLRSLANSLDAVETAVGLSQFSKLKSQAGAIKNAYFDYKNVLTGGEFPAKPYAADVLTEHEKSYRILNVRIKSLLFAINKQH